MLDLALTFENGVYSLSGGVVKDFESTAQAACVCLVTTEGSSPIDPEKGTSLVSRLLTVGASGKQARTHQLSFAALDTQFFLNALDQTRESERISSLQLQEESFVRGAVELNLLLVGELGSVAGVDIQAALL